MPVVKQHRLIKESLEKKFEGIHGLQVLPPHVTCTALLMLSAQLKTVPQ
jgi:hypothetical protein